MSLLLPQNTIIIMFYYFDNFLHIYTGASPDEAVSWGKIRIDAKPVKVCADATLVFSMIVSQTFVKEVARRAAASLSSTTTTADTGK